ncbi:bone morphogenetic protein 1-like isoform X1, partial [Argonauta hians]
MLYPSITVCLVLCIIHTEVLGEDDCEWTNSTTPEYIYIQFPAQANTNYKNNQTCSWQMFSGGKDLAIEMQWTRIDIAISDGCSEDYVQVYNGLNRENGELVDHRCGQSVQIRNIVGRYAFIYFHSNNEDTGKGFEFRYRVVKRVPGIKMKHVSLTAHPYQWQEFTSPYYPMPYYGSDSDRHWLISSEDPREVVHIKFLDFDIEKTLNCSTDSVRIYDGQNENSSLIGKYCGQDFPDVKSTGRKIYISFYADDKGENIGFKAKYLSVKQGSQCSGLTVLKAVRNKKNYLISPDYPHFYSSNLSCSWLITSTAVGRPIYLDVIDSDIEYSQSCMKDYVEIYLGPSRSSPIFSRWCGGTRRKFYTHSSGLLVHFHTDGYFTGRGFQLSYYLIQADSICENPVHVTVLKNVWHTLTSPYYPVVYEGNVTCTWIIEAQNPVHFVELQVDDSEIEESIGCSYDSLSVYDGNQPNSSLIRRWCGTEKPNILSSQSVILIRFHTDVSYEYRGFKFRLRSVDPRSICGPINLIAEKNEVRYLTSPTMAAPHYKSMSCYWLIGATNNDHVVKVSVIVSSFGANNTCKDSYLKAYDGPTEQSELIGNTCGNNTPTYISTGSQMLLTLKSTNPINGFFMSFTGM